MDGHPPPRFFDEAFPERPRDKAQRWFFNKILPHLLCLAQCFTDGFRAPFLNLLIIVGYDAVQEAFTRWQELPVPHDRKTDKLEWDPPFLLARPDLDAEYREMHRKVREYWSNNRINDLRSIANDALTERLRAASSDGAPLDALQDYMYPAFFDIVDRYYGVTFPDPRTRSDFFHALFVISSFFFGSADGDENLKPSAKAAFDQAWGTLGDVINGVVQDPAEQREVVRDLVAAGLHNEEMQSYLLGMILGFIPTSGNAQGRILDVLACRPEAMQAAVAAVAAGDDTALLGVCHEALRLNYILPGLFRVATGDLTLGPERGRRIHIPDQQTVLLSGQAAMLDRRRFPRPCRFEPLRARSSYLNYGHRMHFCVGWDISDIILVETFKVLVQHDFRRAPGGRRDWRGAFPWTYDIEISAA